LYNGLEMLDFTVPSTIAFAVFCGTIFIAFMGYAIFLMVKQKYPRSGWDVFFGIANWILIAVFALALATLLLPATLYFVFDFIEALYLVSGYWMTTLLVAAALGTLFLCAILHIVKTRKITAQEKSELLELIQAKKDIKRSRKIQKANAVVDLSGLDKEVQEQEERAKQQRLQPNEKVGVNGDLFNREFLATAEFEPIEYGTMTAQHLEEVERMMRDMSLSSQEDDNDTETLKDDDTEISADMVLADESPNTMDAIAAQVFAEVREYTKTSEVSKEEHAKYQSSEAEKAVAKNALQQEDKLSVTQDVGLGGHAEYAAQLANSQERLESANQEIPEYYPKSYPQTYLEEWQNAPQTLSEEIEDSSISSIDKLAQDIADAIPETKDYPITGAYDFAAFENGSANDAGAVTESQDYPITGSYDFSSFEEAEPESAEVLQGMPFDEDKALSDLQADIAAFMQEDEGAQELALALGAQDMQEITLALGAQDVVLPLDVQEVQDKFAVPVAAAKTKRTVIPAYMSGVVPPVRVLSLKRNTKTEELAKKTEVVSGAKKTTSATATKKTAATKKATTTSTKKVASNASIASTKTQSIAGTKSKAVAAQKKEVATTATAQKSSKSTAQKSTLFQASKSSSNNTSVKSQVAVSSVEEETVATENAAMRKKYTVINRRSAGAIFGSYLDKMDKTQKDRLKDSMSSIHIDE